jgi:hypothetical protein
MGRNQQGRVWGGTCPRADRPQRLESINRLDFGRKAYGRAVGDLQKHAGPAGRLKLNPRTQTRRLFEGRDCLLKNLLYSPGLAHCCLWILFA